MCIFDTSVTMFSNICSTLLFFFPPVCTSESNYLVLIALDREFNVCERCQVDILEIETLCECDIAIMSASHIFLFVLWS